MKFFDFSLLMLAVLTHAAPPDSKAKGKRGLSDFQPSSQYPSHVYGKAAEPPTTFYSKQSTIDFGKSPLEAYSNPAPAYTKSAPQVSPAYTKSVADLLAKSGPAGGQEYAQYYQSQQVEQASQPVAYTPQPYANGLSGGKGGQKYAFTAPTQNHPQYSSAAEVSSFSYSSPVVAYNNRGLIQQVAGKLAGQSQSASAAYSASAPAPKAQYRQQPKVQYVSAPSAGLAYSAAPSYSSGGSSYSSGGSGYSSGGNGYSAGGSAYPAGAAAYQSEAQAYSAAPSSAYASSAASNNYEDASDAYQQISQKALFSPSSEQPRAVTYQADSAAGQKISYVQSPAPPVYQAKSAPISYVPSTSAQQYSSAAQQYSVGPQYSNEIQYQSKASPVTYVSSPQQYSTGGQQYTSGAQQYTSGGQQYSGGSQQYSSPSQQYSPQASSSSAYESVQSAPELFFSQNVPHSQLFALGTKYSAKPGVSYA